MSRIHILFDPMEPHVQFSPLPSACKYACIDLAEMDATDIYEIARKLAEMLLEQLP